MGAHPGTGPEQGAENETAPPEVAAVQHGPEQHLDVAGGDRGRPGAAAAPGAQHRHPGYRAPDKEAQGSCPQPFPQWPSRKRPRALPGPTEPVAAAGLLPPGHRKVISEHECLPFPQPSRISISREGLEGQKDGPRCRTSPRVTHYV